MDFTGLKLFAGARWSWTECPTGYPAPDYSLDIIFKLGTNAAVTVNGVAQTDGSFTFSKTSAQTALYTHGTYNYQVIATDTNGEKEIVEAGNIEIYPLLSSSADTRTYWQIIVDNYKAAYTKLSARETDSVTIDGDTYTFQDREKLLGFIRRAEKEVERESGTAKPKIFKSRFV